GDVEHVVDALEEDSGDATRLTPVAHAPGSPSACGVREPLRVEATARASWDDAIAGMIFDSRQRPRPGDQLVALLRAGHYLGHIENEQDLLHSILKDAVAVLDAQRGAIALPAGPDG